MIKLENLFFNFLKALQKGLTQSASAKSATQNKGF